MSWDKGTWNHKWINLLVQVEAPFWRRDIDPGIPGDQLLFRAHFYLGLSSWGWTPGKEFLPGRPGPAP